MPPAAVRTILTALRKRTLFKIPAHFAGTQSSNRRSGFSPQQRTGVRNGLDLMCEWFARWRPIKEEIAIYRRRSKQITSGFDTYVPNMSRYFVRFPFLLDSEFAQWIVTSDRDLGLGYSWAEFIRSPKSAAGCAEPIGPDVQRPAQATMATTPVSTEEEDDSHPFALTYPVVNPTLCPSPCGQNAARSAVVIGALDSKFQGYGLFRGFLSTRVPDRGDLARAGFVNLRCPDRTHFGSIHPYLINSHTHLVIRYRGDGRSYRINLLPKHKWDVFENDVHHFALYTRGGPYWQIAKIPLSKFFVLRAGRIGRSQYMVDRHNLRALSFTVMDGVDGPFSLELDYIMFHMDPDDRDAFAYEQYDRAGSIG